MVKDIMAEPRSQSSSGVPDPAITLSDPIKLSVNLPENTSYVPKSNKELSFPDNMSKKFGSLRKNNGKSSSKKKACCCCP